MKRIIITALVAVNLIMIIGCGGKKCMYAGCNKSAKISEPYDLCEEHFIQITSNRAEEEESSKSAPMYKEEDFVGHWESDHKYDELEKEYVSGNDGDDIEVYYVFNSDGTAVGYVFNRNNRDTLIQKSKWSIEDDYIYMRYQGDVIDSLKISGTTLIAPYDNRVKCKKVNPEMQAPKIYLQ